MLGFSVPEKMHLDADCKISKLLYHSSPKK